MPSNSSAEKRHRQNLKNRLRNRSFKSELRTRTKSFVQSIVAKDNTGAETMYRELESMLDRGVNKGIVHRNTASRKKSRLHRLMGRG